MDVERTMNFILGSQAKAEVRMERLEKQVESTANLAELAGAVDAFIRNLVRAQTATRPADFGLLV